MKYNIMLALRTVTDKQLAEVAVRMADIHTPTFERILVEVLDQVAYQGEKIRFRVPDPFGREPSQVYVSFTPKELLDIQATGLAGNKVSGIKLIRELTKLGLREAKDLYEKMVDDKVVDLKPYSSPSY